MTSRGMFQAGDPAYVEAMGQERNQHIQRMHPSSSTPKGLVCRRGGEQGKVADTEEEKRSRDRIMNDPVGHIKNPSGAGRVARRLGAGLGCWL